MQVGIDKITKVNIMPESVAEEVAQNVRQILATRRGSVPLDRDLGVNYEFLDRPVNEVQLYAIPAVIQALQDFEPRAYVDSIRFQEQVAALSGALSPVVDFSLEEEGL